MTRSDPGLEYTKKTRPDGSNDRDDASPYVRGSFDVFIDGQRLRIVAAPSLCNQDRKDFNFADGLDHGGDVRSVCEQAQYMKRRRTHKARTKEVRLAI